MNTFAKILRFSPIYMFVFLVSILFWEVYSDISRVQIIDEIEIFSFFIALVFGLTLISLIFRNPKSILTTIFATLLPFISMIISLFLIERVLLFSFNNIVVFSCLLGSILVFFFCNISKLVLIIFGSFYAFLLLVLLLLINFSHILNVYLDGFLGVTT